MFGVHSLQNNETTKTANVLFLMQKQENNIYFLFFSALDAGRFPCSMPTQHPAMVGLPPPQSDNVGVDFGRDLLVPRVCVQMLLGELQEGDVAPCLGHGVQVGIVGGNEVGGVRQVGPGVPLEHPHEWAVQTLPCGNVSIGHWALVDHMHAAK